MPYIIDNIVEDFSNYIVDNDVIVYLLDGDVLIKSHAAHTLNNTQKVKEIVRGYNVIINNVDLSNVEHIQCYNIDLETTKLSDKLKYLNVFAKIVGNAAFEKSLEALHNIKYKQYCSETYYTINNNTFSKLSNLIELSVHNIQLSIQLESCKNLRKLSIEYLNTKYIPLLYELKYLEQLRIFSFEFNTGAPKDISNCNFGKIPNIRDLCIKLTFDTISGFNIISKTLKKLKIKSKCINIEHCPNINYAHIDFYDEAPYKIFLNNEIETVISNMESNKVANCLQNYTNIKTLILDRYRGNINFVKYLYKLEQFTVLQTEDSSPLVSCKELNTLTIIRIHKNTSHVLLACSKLKNINIKSSDNITNIKSSNIINLSLLLYIGNIDYVTNFVNLKYLHVREIEDITPLVYCKNLVSLRVCTYNKGNLNIFKNQTSQHQTLKVLCIYDYIALSSLEGLSALTKINHLALHKIRDIQKDFINIFKNATYIKTFNYTYTIESNRNEFILQNTREEGLKQRYEEYVNSWQNNASTYHHTMNDDISDDDISDDDTLDDDAVNDDNINYDDDNNN
jgi:hypothetical protein